MSNNDKASAPMQKKQRRCQTSLLMELSMKILNG